MKRIFFVLLSTMLLISLFCQTYQDYNPNYERFRMLALEQAKIRLELSERNWKNAKELFDRKMISQDEYLQHEAQFKNDRINYDIYLLGVIFDNPYITIQKADKIKDENGEVFVQLTIKNSSGGNIGIEEYILDDTMGNRVNITEIYNLYVSIKDLERNTISLPYEYHIKSLGFEKTFSMRFKLLKDVESVIISTVYGDKVTEKQIYLTRRQDSNMIMIRPDIYA